MPRAAGTGTVSAFTRVFSVAMVRSLAAPRSFERGEIYAATGHVQRLRRAANAAEAIVRGTASYAVAALS